VKGPYLTGLSDTHVDVRFELDSPGRGTVAITREAAGEGRGGEGGSPEALEFSDRKLDAFHVVSASGLAPATRYSYVVRVGGVTLGTGHFSTGPTPDGGAPITFLVYGDDRTDPSAHQLVVRAMATTPSDVLVNTGDLVEDGASALDWQSFFDAESSLLRDRAVFVAIGNHELYDDAAGANFAHYFGLAGATAGTGGAQPYGSVRLGGVRFFFLNGMHDWDSGDERQWLEHELAGADAEPGLGWRVVVVHHGPWSAGPHGGNSKLLDAHVPELLAAHKVDLILSGHDHIYERGDAGPLKYIISGGGGAPLYRVAGPTATTRKAEATYHFVEIRASTDALRVVAHRLDGSVIETCGVLKQRPWDCDPVPGPAAARVTEAAGTTPRGPGTPSAGGTSPSVSRCGCEVPGARHAGSFVLAIAGFAMAAGLRVLRRVRRS
jgi:hypothetical protein